MEKDKDQADASMKVAKGPKTEKRSGKEGSGDHVNQSLGLLLALVISSSMVGAINKGRSDPSVIKPKTSTQQPVKPANVIRNVAYLGQVVLPEVLDGQAGSSVPAAGDHKPSTLPALAPTLIPKSSLTPKPTPTPTRLTPDYRVDSNYAAIQRMATPVIPLK